MKTESLLVHLLVQFPQRHRCRAAAEEMRPGGRDGPDCSREVAKEQLLKQLLLICNNVCLLPADVFFNQGPLTGIFHGNRLAAEGIDASCECHSWLELLDGGQDGPAQSC